MQKGDIIQLSNQNVEVVECQGCSHHMVNIDAEQLVPGELKILKLAKVRVSNPETEKPVCVNCEHRTFGRRLADWFEDEEDEDDDSFFSSAPSSSGRLFGGSSGFGGFGGGFGGFGGGISGGGGASRGF